MYTFIPVQLKRAGNKCVRCAKHTHKLFHLSGAGECHPSSMGAKADSDTKAGSAHDSE